ncbi:hypothetical protein DFP78_104222 [Photobacterium lutimaris]|nr:hypothetical protein DFP78_104222 [Photobacterium lutimaris]
MNKTSLFCIGLFGNVRYSEVFDYFDHITNSINGMIGSGDTK